MVKILELFDFTQCVLPEQLFDIKIPQKEIDKKIETAAEHFLTIEEQNDAVRKGDIVAVKIESSDSFLQSDCARFSAGKGFFSEEIEQAVIGKKKNDTLSLEVNGSPAQVTILWVKRRIVPELTDAMAAEMGIEDVNSVQEYTEYATSELVEEDKEKKQNAIWLLVSKKLTEDSKFEIDEEEIETQYKRTITYLRQELADDFEEFMQVKYHGETLEESKQLLKAEIEKTLKLCAIAKPMADENGIEWTEEEYEAVIDEMVNEEYSREELKQSMSYEDYVMQQMEAFLQAAVLEYFDDRFTVTIV